MLKRLTTDLANLKPDIDKLDIDELETTLTDLSKLDDAVKNKVVKKIVYDELVGKGNAIKTTDTSDLVKKADCDTKIGEIEKKYLIMIMINIFLFKNLIR